MGRLHLALLTICAGLRAAAEVPVSEPPIAADRSRSMPLAEAVPADRIQIELGLGLAREREGLHVRIPELLLRYGASGAIELAIGLSTIDLVYEERDAARTDLGPIDFGLKFAYAVGPAVVSVLPAAAVPVTSADIDRRGVGLGADLLWLVDATGWLTFGGGAGMAVTGLGGQRADRRYRFGAYAEAWALDPVGLFIDVSTVFLEREAALAPLHLGAGVLWRASPKVQLRASAGLNARDSGEWFTQLGVAVRY